MPLTSCSDRGFLWEFVLGLTEDLYREGAAQDWRRPYFCPFLPNRNGIREVWSAGEGHESLCH